MTQREAVTGALATRYRRADREGKGRILDELCAMTGWRRNHARKALAGALVPKAVKPRAPRPPEYGPEAVEALVFCWAVLGMPAGKRLAPMLPALVGRLRECGELVVSDETADLLGRMSAATIDRRLAGERAKQALARGRSRTKPGSLLKHQIPIRTWAQWDDDRPGFLEIDLVAHDGGSPLGEHAWTLTATDVATGWVEHRSVRNKARKWVVAALDEIAQTLPFPLLGIDSDNGSEFINHHLLAWCEQREATFTRGRPGNSNDGCHVEQKNWTGVRQTVGYLRHDTPAELAQLGRIWEVQSQLANHFYPQQKLLEKTRDGAKVHKRHDTAATPAQRLARHPATNTNARAEVEHAFHQLNPAALQRQLQKLVHELTTLATTKRAKTHEATTQLKRAI